MPIRIKDRSSIKKLFGLTKDFGAFANNTVIKNNPQLLSILTSKGTRIKFKKKAKDIDFKRIIEPFPEKLAASSIELSENKTTTSITSGCFYKWQSENRDSYCKIYLQPNLFGHWRVTSEWVGIKNKIGRFETKIFDRYEEAVNFINQLNLKRKQKKYELTQII